MLKTRRNLCSKKTFCQNWAWIMKAPLIPLWICGVPIPACKMSTDFARLFLMMSCATSEWAPLIIHDFLLTRRRFFVAYRDIACTIYPVVPDTGSFEDTLTFML